MWLGVRLCEEPRLLVGLRGLGLESSRRWWRVDRLRVEWLRLLRWRWVAARRGLCDVERRCLRGVECRLRREIERRRVDLVRWRRVLRDLDLRLGRRRESGVRGR